MSSKEEPQRQTDHNYTRREVIVNGLTSAALIVGMNAFAWEPHDITTEISHEIDIMKNQNIDKQRLEKDAQLFREHNIMSDYLQTALISSMTALGAYVASQFLESKFLKEHGYTIGNSAMPKFLALFESDDPKKEEENTKIGCGEVAAGCLGLPLLVLTVVAGAPLIEEAIFRKGVEDMFANQLPADGGIGWNIGIPAAVCFALMHNQVLDGKTLRHFKMNKIPDLIAKSFDTKTIPLPQFIGGLLNWYLLRKKGFLHAVEAHSVWNTSSVPILIGQAVAKGISQRLDLRSRNLRNQETQEK